MTALRSGCPELMAGTGPRARRARFYARKAAGLPPQRSSLQCGGRKLLSGIEEALEIINDPFSVSSRRRKRAVNWCLAALRNDLIKSGVTWRPMLHAERDMLAAGLANCRAAIAARSSQASQETSSWTR